MRKATIIPTFSFVAPRVCRGLNFGQTTSHSVEISACGVVKWRYRNCTQNGPKAGISSDNGMFSSVSGDPPLSIRGLSCNLESCMVVLESERLLFREHEPGDLDAYCAMEADPEVRRYVG